MSGKTAARPALARKVTPGSEKSRLDALDQGVKFTIDDATYEVRVGDVTPQLGREIRNSLGMSFQKLMDEVVRDVDVDTISAFVWIARRIKGEQVALDDVTVTYADMLSDGFDIDVAGAEEVEDSPEE